MMYMFAKLYLIQYYHGKMSSKKYHRILSTDGTVSKLDCKKNSLDSVTC